MYVQLPDWLYDDGDDNDVDFIIAACLAARSLKRSRRSPHQRKRLDWKAHVKRLHKEGQFERMYRMSYTSFKKLLHLLEPYLQVNEGQGSRRTSGNGHLTPELILHCLIRYMAGGSHHDI